ncbi:MAG: WD40 repeat domain-containing serine/threonine-protein kinase [Planctomycetota bacterium]
MTDPIADRDGPDGERGATVDWDAVEQLAFECLERRAAAGDAAAGARAVDELLAARPALAPHVRRILAETSGPQQLSQPLTQPLAGVARPERLGPYRLGERLGQGGMGTVFAARDEVLGRDVAIKLVRADLLLAEHGRERFRREVEAVARLSHPGIVPVFQCGEDHGVPWFAMELVRGPTLAALLRQLRGPANAPRAPESLTGADLQRAMADAALAAAVPGSSSSTAPTTPASWEHACLQLAQQLAEALAHAHARGVLHRDVKPSNVALDAAGRARLLDFGLARAEGSGELTRTGAALGSLPYMAPEQVRGDLAAISARTDVYGLGVLLYELLTLRSPFVAATEDETRRRVLAGDAPPAQRRNRALSWEAAAVCAVAMDPDPARRYADMAAFAADLGRVRERRPILARPPGAGRRLWRLVQRNPARATLATAVVLAVLGAPSIYSLGLARQRDTAVRAQQEAERLQRLDRLRSYRSSVQAAFLALQLGQAAAAREQLDRCPEELRGWEWGHLDRQVDQGFATFAVEGGFLRRAKFAPPGLFAAGASGTVHVWSLPDGAPVRSFGDPGGSAILTMAVSADGRHVLTGHLDHRARLWDGRDGALRATFDLGELYDEPPQPHQRGVFAVAIAADGARACAGSAGGAVLWIDPERAASTGSFRVAVRRGGPFALALRPDGAGVAAACDTDVLLLDRDGVERQRLRGHSGLVFGLEFAPPDARRDGDLLLSASQDRTARLWSVATGALHAVFAGHDGEVHDAAFAPDGRTVWTASNDGTLRRFDVARGVEVQRRLGHRGAVYGVAVAADGTVATAGWDRSARLWHPDATPARTRVGEVGRTLRDVALHPDGRGVTVLDHQHGARAWALPDGAPIAPLVGVGDSAGAERAAVGDDGRLAFARDRVVHRGAGDAALGETARAVRSLAWHGADWLVAGLDNGDLAWWPAAAAAGAAPTVRPAHGDAVAALLSTPAGLLSVGRDGLALLWRDPDRRREVLRANTPWNAAALLPGAADAPDECAVALAGTGRLLAWSLDRDRVLWDAPDRPGELRALCVTADGRRLLTGGSDRALHVIDSADGTELLALPADNLLNFVGAAGDAVVTATVYSEVDVWRGGAAR